MKILRIVTCCAFLLMTIDLFAQTELDVQTKRAELKLQEAMKKYSLEHPEVEALSAQLEALNRGMAPKGSPTSPLKTLQTTMNGMFWRNPEWIRVLELSADQQKKMDDIFQQYRLKLIDLNASLQKEELILEPLLSGTKPAPDAEAKITSQVDRIADARAELEKANSRMLVNILQVLNADQWSKLPLKTTRANFWPPIYKKTQ